MKTIIQVARCQGQWSSDFMKVYLPCGTMKFRHKGYISDEDISKFASNLNLTDYEVVNTY